MTKTYSSDDLFKSKKYAHSSEDLTFHRSTSLINKDDEHKSSSTDQLSSGEALSHVLNSMSEMADTCAVKVEHLAKKVLDFNWKALPHTALPKWMRDNEYLLSGHRPPTNSVLVCLASTFRMHTETLNIWTHLLGMGLFTFWFLEFMLFESVHLPNKLVVILFFVGAISCLSCSTAFHIFSCHSCRVSKIFNKIDYCGISMLVIGSFIPWLYYAFHCRFTEKLIYLIVLCVLGAATIYVSLIDRFSTPAYRSTRAAVFVVFGLSAVIPCGHHMIIFGVSSSFKYASITWLIIMGVLYITGALLYAIRVPERFFPGKCDIWFQSHQLFHVLVVAAASVHYYGIMSLVMNHQRLCPLSEIDAK